MFLSQLQFVVKIWTEQRVYSQNDDYSQSYYSTDLKNDNDKYSYMVQEAP